MPYGDSTSMAPAGIRACLQWARNPSQDTLRWRRKLSVATKPIHPSTSVLAKPRPQPAKSDTLPLVGIRASTPRSTPTLTKKISPTPKEDAKGVFAPYLRISLGMVLCGSIIYSMVAMVLVNLVPQAHPHACQFPSPLQLEPSSIVERDTLIKRENGVMPSSPMRLRMEAFIKSQQTLIVDTLQQLDLSHKFRIDTWTRPNGGGGISCVLQDGTVFEKAGVNTSVVYGTLPRPAIEKMRIDHKALDPDVDSLEFFAAGLSCVLHPQNPNAPTVHFNYRYFETMDTEGNCNAWWFGGGTDLTPSYLFDEDAIHFHKTIKDACDKHDRAYFPRFKVWCDKYFFIPHRGETRGVGGIFFDDLDEQEKDQEQLFSFTRECLHAFLPSYIPLIQKRKDMPFTQEEKDWQQLRRGRYVEFNLVHDRGTSFGLNTPGARVESILMSLPLTARWQYMHEVEKGSREERLATVLKEPREWV